MVFRFGSKAWYPGKHRNRWRIDLDSPQKWSGMYVLNYPVLKRHSYPSRGFDSVDKSSGALFLGSVLSHGCA